MAATGSPVQQPTRRGTTRPPGHARPNRALGLAPTLCPFLLADLHHLQVPHLCSPSSITRHSRTLIYALSPATSSIARRPRTLACTSSCVACPRARPPEPPESPAACAARSARGETLFQRRRIVHFCVESTVFSVQRNNGYTFSNYYLINSILLYKQSFYNFFSMKSS